MIELNGKKFAENENEFSASLFEAGGTCVGYYKVNAKSITIFDAQHVKIGVINSHGVLAKATLTEDGWFYSYGTIKEVGEYRLYSDSVNEPTNLIRTLCGKYCNCGSSINANIVLNDGVIRCTTCRKEKRN